MRLLIAMFVLLMAWCAAQVPTPTKTAQSSTGNCSPNIISSASGPVTVQLTGSCAGVDPRLIKKLTDSLQKFLDRLPELAADRRTVRNLNDLLEKKDVELADRVKEVEGWIEKYNELEQRVQVQSPDDELSKQASEALKEGNLNRAEALLKDLAAKQEKQVTHAARNHFNLAEVYELKFQPLQALPEYAKAYQYRPEEFQYAFSYATLLYKQNQHAAAEPVYVAALKAARQSSSDNLPSHLPALATTLNNLGILYNDTQRPKEAEAAHTESLTIRRQLAKENASLYLPDVAMSLNNLGVLFGRTQRLKEAEAALTECLATYRQLQQENPSAYFSDVAMTLNNLGLLYTNTQRPMEAEAAFTESLNINRQLVGCPQDTFIIRAASLQ